MGAQSDFVSETFVPSLRHQQERARRARVLLSSGMPLREVASMLSVPEEQLGEELSREHALD